MIIVYGFCMLWIIFVMIMGDPSGYLPSDFSKFIGILLMPSQAIMAVIFILFTVTTWRELRKDGCG